MTTADTVALPGEPADDGVVKVALGFPQRLERAAWFFSAFLLVFPVIAVAGTYITERTLLLSLPLLLMMICGAFGMRLSLHLERTS